jgi:hypothetical protein
MAGQRGEGETEQSTQSGSGTEEEPEEDALSTAGSITGLRRAALREGIPLTGN